MPKESASAASGITRSFLRVASVTPRSKSDPTSQSRTLGQDLMAARQADANDSVRYHSLIVLTSAMTSDHLSGTGAPVKSTAWRTRGEYQALMATQIIAGLRVSMSQK
jgi:hypothetical protein